MCVEFAGGFRNQSGADSIQRKTSVWFLAISVLVWGLMHMCFTILRGQTANSLWTFSVAVCLSACRVRRQTSWSKWCWSPRAFACSRPSRHTAFSRRRRTRSSRYRSGRRWCSPRPMRTSESIPNSVSPAGHLDPSVASEQQRFDANIQCWISLFFYIYPAVGSESHHEGSNTDFSRIGQTTEGTSFWEAWTCDFWYAAP